jgi:hypothetical protein
MRAAPSIAIRDGFLLGEGAGVLVLERAEFARARGAPRIYCEIAGYETNCDAYSIMMLEGEAPHRRHAPRRPCQERADDAGRRYVNAHGTSTIPNDRLETKVFREIFGPDAGSLAHLVDEVDDRARRRRLGRHRGRRHRARAPQRRAASDDQPREPRPRVRPRLHPQTGEERVRVDARDQRVRTASAATTPRSRCDGCRALLER